MFVTLLITACSDNGADNNSDSSNTNDDQSAEVTLDSKMGEVTIPSNTERVVAPYHEDALLALGITPVAKWAIGETTQGYLEDQLKDIPKLEWNMPQEQVLNHEPDLIILENALDSYEALMKTIKNRHYLCHDRRNNKKNWRQQIKTFGKLFDKESKAQEVLDQYDDKVANAKETLNKAIGDETVAAIWAKGDQFYLFEQNRQSAEVLYSELGISQPDLVKELGKAQTQWNPISLEKLSKLKADHVFLLAKKEEQGLQTLKDSTVWQSTPAVKKRQCLHHS